MATHARSAVRPPAGWPATRTVEWGILSAVALVIALVAGHYVRGFQAQAERSAVLSTLGALRTALTIAHLQGASASASASYAAPPGGTPVNPFLVLQALPLNYRGESSIAAMLAVPTGGWVYDPQCVCVGYVPLDTDWSDGARQTGALWFKVGSGPGPLQLTAQSAYVWRGLPVQ